MDLIIIISFLVLGAVVVAVVGMYLVFGGFLPKLFAVWAVAHDKDLVDPDAEIMPRQERHSSEVLKDLATEVKHLDQVPVEPVISQPPPTAPEIASVVPAQPIPPVQPGQVAPEIVPAATVQPVPMQPPPPPAADVPVAPPIAEAPQELVQRAPILDVPNPIVQQAPQNTVIDAQIPDVEAYNQAENKSSFGVRYSSNSSGRVLRDKRRRRNAAD